MQHVFHGFKSSLRASVPNILITMHVLPENVYLLIEWCISDGSYHTHTYIPGGHSVSLPRREAQVVIA